MKIKDNFVLKDMGDFTVVIAVGESLKKFNCMITLNESGKLLWQELEKGTDEQGLVNSLLSVYEVDEQTAKTHVEQFIAKLKEANILE